MAQYDYSLQSIISKKLIILSVLMLACLGIWLALSVVPPKTSQGKPGSQLEANTIVNHQLGISLKYPDYFTYGIDTSQTANVIHISSYDLGQNYTQPPQGLRVEINRLLNLQNLPLQELSLIHI